MSYSYPYQDGTFVLKHLVRFDELCAAAGLTDSTLELATSVLEEAARLGTEVIAPLNWSGDQNPPRLGPQGVEASPGFTEAYRQFAESGWLSLAPAEAFGGQNLPNVLNTAVNEIWQSACLSFALCPMLSMGAMESIGHHASPALQAQYLPKLASGLWTGTMNLTEPDAGSDLAAVKTRAVPVEDHYLISGQKIYITWGDHQMTENIIHLVLARLPDAPAGVKGISLFLVPKFLLDAEGQPATRNAAYCLSLEHKLGIHASPTCVMEFKEAVGYLIGEPNKGLSYMFTMMNHARQGVGLQGLAVSERAYQQGRQFAKERLQGTRRDGSRIPIIQHPDVRRMLMIMKAGTEAMRALALVAAAEVDRARYAADAATQAVHAVRVELYTPIVKGWLTEFAQECSYLNIQIHGGMGFIEETGAAQHYRDARILTIYEGTTGIQALDFIGRKTLSDQGVALDALLRDIQVTLETLQAAATVPAEVTEALAAGLERGVRARQWLLAQASSDTHLPGSVSFNFLMLFGYLCGAWLLAESAHYAQRELQAGRGDAAFLQTKLVTARFFAEHLLPRTQAHLSAMLAGSASIMALSDDQF